MQSLTSVCSEAVSELDRENAHFEVNACKSNSKPDSLEGMKIKQDPYQVCEAIIEAFEQISTTEDESEDSDDSEISADHIRDYASSLTVPSQHYQTPNSSPISPAIVRKSASTPSLKKLR